MTHFQRTFPFFPIHSCTLTFFTSPLTDYLLFSYHNSIILFSDSNRNGYMFSSLPYFLLSVSSSLSSTLLLCYLFISKLQVLSIGLIHHDYLFSNLLSYLSHSSFLDSYPNCILPSLEQSEFFFIQRQIKSTFVILILRSTISNSDHLLSARTI